MKALRRSFLCSNFAEYAVLAKSTSFWLAFLHRNLTWGSNGSWLSKWISRSFSHLLLEMTIPSILIWISCVYFVGRCDFSGFTFRRLSMNHQSKVLEIFPRLCNTLFIFLLVEWGLLSPTYMEQVAKKYVQQQWSKYGALWKPEDNFRPLTVRVIQFHSLFSFS